MLYRKQGAEDAPVPEIFKKGTAFFQKSIKFDFLRAFYHSEMKALRSFMEWQAFGVCSAIGEKLGIATSRIRMWFIYVSFLTMGSPLILYMIMAFWINIKKYTVYTRRNPLWYW